VIRVELPAHLRTLACCEHYVQLDVAGPVTIAAILDAVELKFPMLRGTVRDQITGRRRPLVRFFVCECDWSDEPFDRPLPETVAAGDETFIILGAIAGGLQPRTLDSRED
jgi:hypothetical protein